MIRMGKTGVVAFCTACSRLLGFVRVSLIGFLFGATGQADVLNLVFQIPNNLRRLLAEGALSAAFIPVLSNAHAASPSGKSYANRFVQAMFGFQLVSLIPFLLVATLFSAPITRLLFDFGSVEQIVSADRLFKILIWYILPMSITVVCMAILNTHEHFAIPAISPLVSSLAVIIITLLFHSRIGIYAVGVGIVCGGAMQIVIHLPRLHRYGYRLVPRIDVKDHYFRLMLRKWGVTISSALLLFVNQQVAVYFASGLEVGSGSALTYALTFWQLPLGILGISAITVLYPQMSNHYAHARHAELQATLYSGLRHLLCMLLPATIFLFIFADDIIHVALQRGKFTFFDTLNTARVLRAYSVGLMGVAFFQYLQRFYYAIHKIAFTIRILAFIVIVDIALSWWLKDTRLAVSALGWANSIAFSLGALLYYLRLPYARRGSRAMRAALIWLLKVAVSVSAPTLLLFCYQFAFPLSEESAAPLLRLIAILISACGYTFFVLWLYGRFRVMHSIKDFFARRTRHGKE